ncbi:hypothetical protein ACC760_38105, partial [Rhizobium ruizarguesonis]
PGILLVIGRAGLSGDVAAAEIDRIQDRYGKNIFRHEERLCEGCNAGDWQNQEEPNIVDNRETVLDPMTAYQITSMMQGVIQRGTAAGKVDLG